MNASEQFLKEVRGALAQAGSGRWLDLRSIDVYLGANPLSDRPAVVFGLRLLDPGFSAAKLKKSLELELDLHLPAIEGGGIASSSAKAASLIAAATAALLVRELRLPAASGARPGGEETAEGWFEYLMGTPAGAALQTVLLAAALGYRGRKASGQIGAQLTDLRQACEKCRPNKMSSYLIAAARSRDIPYLPLARSKAIWQFGWGSRGRSFLGAACNEDGYVGFNIAKLKSTAKWVFRELGIPTPRWTELRPDDDPAAAVARIGFPCVVKPTDSSFGDGVTANISGMAEYEAAVALARGRDRRKLLVEARQPGDDHRLMVVDGRLVAAVRRTPPAIVGDGVRTVGQLIGDLNASRHGAPEEIGFLSPVEIDSTLLFRLQSQGLALDSLLPKGRNLALRTAANRTGGGTAEDVSAHVHPQVRAWAEQLATTIGLRVAGIDYVTPDIASDPRDVGGGFIEINATPGLQVLAAAGVDHVAVCRAILGTAPGRIPVDLVLADESAIAESLASLPRVAGHAIAWPKGMEIDGSFIDPGGLTPFEIAGAVLRNRSVTAATFVWTEDEMKRFGLPVDRIRRTTIEGSIPEDRWGALLKRASAELIDRRARRMRQTAMEEVA